MGYRQDSLISAHRSRAVEGHVGNAQEPQEGKVMNNTTFSKYRTYSEYKCYSIIQELMELMLADTHSFRSFIKRPKICNATSAFSSRAV